jgi:hypothetical protein
MFQKLEIDKLWIAFGKGKDLRWIPIHEISNALGPRALCLPFVHAFTSCDTVSAFRGKGKRTAWQVWEIFDEVNLAKNSKTGPKHYHLDMLPFLYVRATLPWLVEWHYTGVASGLTFQDVLCLPFVHAFTSCDTVSAFRGKGKRTAWQVWEIFDDATDTFFRLSQTPAVIDDQDMEFIEAATLPWLVEWHYTGVASGLTFQDVLCSWETLS